MKKVALRGFLAYLGAVAVTASAVLTVPVAAEAAEDKRTTLALGINDRGTVVGGLFSAADAERFESRPVIWQGGTAQQLPIDGTAFGVNEQGTVVGGFIPGFVDGEHTVAAPGNAFQWRNGQTTLLPTPQGARSTAADVNNFGVVTGTVFDSIETNDEGVPVARTSRAVIWFAGLRQDLGSLGGQMTRALDINEWNQVVGLGRTASGEIHGFLWSNGQMTDLGTLGGSYSAAYSVNDQGQVVGVSTDATGQTHGFLWSNGQMTDLGELSVGTIANQGQIVGSAVFPVGDQFERHFARWSNGELRDLGSPEGYQVDGAVANEKGLIAGFRYGDEPMYRAVTWSNGTFANLPMPAETVATREHSSTGNTALSARDVWSAIFGDARTGLRGLSLLSAR